MDSNLQALWEIKKTKMKKAYQANNMIMEFFDDTKALQTYVSNKIATVTSVSVGGSMTLFETGVIDCIKKSGVTYYDRYAEGLSTEEIQAVFRQAFLCDLYFTSTNALTEDGALYNIDGNGNRVAAMIYGPKEVIVVTGKNKICKTEKEALQRMQHMAAPANATRLHKNTPCIKTGECMDCSSAGRICSSYVKLGYQGNKNRITICVMEKDFGY